MKTEVNNDTKRKLAIVLIVGLAIRLALAPFFSDYSDFSFWTGVAFDVMNGDGIYTDYDLWYPPVWGYVVALVTPLLKLFGCTPLETVVEDASSIGYAVGDGWIASSGTVFIIKLPLIASDILCGLLVFAIACHITDDVRKQLGAAALWTLCPLTIYTSSVQGQFDTIEALLLLLAIWCYIKGTYAASGAFIAASVLTKPFTALVVLPLLALIWTYGSFRKQKVTYVSAYILGGVAMTAFLILPQIINGETQYLMGFLSGRYGTQWPLPSGFSMSIMPTVQSVDIGGLSPSGGNMNRFLPLSFVISLVLTVFVFVKGRMNDRSAVLILGAASCCHLIWWSATGYVQYYVPAMAVLALCSVIDRRFTYAAVFMNLFALIPAFWGFRHAYQLLELGLADTGMLQSFYGALRSSLDLLDSIASNLKFLPLLVTVILSLYIVRGDRSEH